MHITKLRLAGFKSFVEPTELLIEPGLTGVVGPNGCGKSNLLEALRWSMGETSIRSMRAAAMDDVIFAGTTTRPARNMAEVTLFIDNASRTAPAGFNDRDVLEVARRIEREEGSTYLVNGREVRARDIKLLFDDAATGARSPALVRQGQIGEVVNAKPEQRRRILEDAAGIAGLHTRRHEAELRLKATEANLQRIADVLGQLGSQLESLKRQARQAQRYKQLSETIRRAEAAVAHALWVGIEQDVAAGEAELARVLAAVAAAVEAESRTTTAEHEAAIVLPTVRQAEAERGAALQRVRLEAEAFERALAQAGQRRVTLEAQLAAAARDLERETAQQAEARDLIATLDAEAAALARAEDRSADALTNADSTLRTAQHAAATMEQRLAGLQMAAAEARARRSSLEQAQRHHQADLAAAKAHLAALPDMPAPDAGQASEDAAAAEAVVAELEATFETLEGAVAEADAAVRVANDANTRARADLQAAELAAAKSAAELATLERLLPPTTGDAPPVADTISTHEGDEPAVGAALGEDVEAPADPASPRHWASVAPRADDPALPAGATPLHGRVRASKLLARRLAQTGLVASPADGARLQKQLRPGQTLVTAAGDLWRWDGFVAKAGARPSGQRIALRRRLDALTAEVAARQAAVEDAEARASEAAESLAQAERDLQRARDAVRATEARLSAARATAVRLVHAADMAEAQRTAAMAAHELASETEATVARRLREVTLALETLADVAGFEDQLQEALDEAAERRAAVAEARSRRGTLEAERGQRHARRSAIADERARAQSRVVAASEQIAVLEARKAAAADALAAEIDADPDGIEARRAAFRDATAAAEAAHRTASDDLARAETALRSVQGSLRAAQAAVASTREGLVRIETRLEGVRQRRLEHVRKTQDALGVLPDACRDLAGDQLPDPLPAPDALEARLAGLRAERERLGGVNLAADDDLSVAQSRFDTLDGERADVEAAVAKLRDAIAALNRDAKGRLDAAFEQVDAHFRRLFDVLFGGGEARLDMIRSETDPLEGGLEIIARPPGKKPATLSLLSGGEQTLTALSLIFAVFLTNPAPICVLDEVDAPLDDSNVDRFCTLMERMAAETATRFLVITHHPMTMARMNRLFGVTMAEKGVSQLVSVDLEAAQKIVETDVAA